MAHDVFISYSTQDKPVADAACARLEARAIRCWMAPRDILPGVPWAEALIEAIESSKVMVLIFSSNANSSQQIQREVERAVHKGIAIVPLRIEDVAPTKTLEYFISTPHWLDALTPPIEQHVERLVVSVESLLTRIAPLWPSEQSERAAAAAAPAPVQESWSDANRHVGSISRPEQAPVAAPVKHAHRAARPGAAPAVAAAAATAAPTAAPATASTAAPTTAPRATSPPSGVLMGAVAAIVLALAVVVYMWTSRSSTEPAAGTAESSAVAQPGSSQAAGSPAQTPASQSDASAPSAGAQSPTVNASQPAAPPPQAANTREASAPASRPGKAAASPSASSSSRPAAPREADSAAAKPSAPAASEAPPPPPLAETSAPAPPVAAPAIPSSSVMLRHSHARRVFGRGLFKGGAYCDGYLEILTDGLHFKTVTTADGREDDKKIRFSEINDYGVEGDRLNFETGVDWNFTGSKDALQRILKVLEANVKS